MVRSRYVYRPDIDWALSRLRMRAAGGGMRRKIKQKNQRRDVVKHGGKVNGEEKEESGSRGKEEERWWWWWCSAWPGRRLGAYVTFAAPAKNLDGQRVSRSMEKLRAPLRLWQCWEGRFTRHPRLAGQWGGRKTAKERGRGGMRRTQAGGRGTRGEGARFTYFWCVVQATYAVWESGKGLGQGDAMGDCCNDRVHYLIFFFRRCR